MTQAAYQGLYEAMRACLYDAVHDEGHILRVLYTALDMARAYPQARRDVLIAACLLHDIGRREEAENGGRHAQIGAQKALKLLQMQGFDAAFCEHACACIATHSMGSDRPPESIEACLLFDADKLDTTGALGTARVLMYHGEAGSALYETGVDGMPADGAADQRENYFQEYQMQLRTTASRMLTSEGRRRAQQKQQTADAIFGMIYTEAAACHEQGLAALRLYLDPGDRRAKP